MEVGALMDAKLIMFRKDGRRKEFSVGDSPFVIGRGENCELRIPFVSISRRHCQFIVQEGQVIAKDLGSSNGTFVNNKKITGEQPLKAGDRIIVGPVIFTLQIDGKPEEIKPPKLKRKAAKATQPAGVAEAGEDTGAPLSGEESDPIAALEDLVAEALKEDEEDEDKDEDDEKEDEKK
jgi:pSer/pThr/pTyr-binding forkhead associated (FHA) protein